MSALRIGYLLSLALLAVLLGLTLFRPLVSGAAYGEVLRQQLVQTRDEWIIQLDIFNREGGDARYVIDVVVDGRPNSSAVTVNAGRQFGYAYHIYKAEVGEAEAALAVYRDGEQTPIERITYHLTRVAP